MLSAVVKRIGFWFQFHNTHFTQLAAISLFGSSLVPYYLEETANWGLDAADLRQSVITACSKGITVGAMVIINPGNPTGQCLSETNLREIINFCIQENLVLLVMKFISRMYTRMSALLSVLEWC